MSSTNLPYHRLPLHARALLHEDQLAESEDEILGLLARGNAAITKGAVPANAMTPECTASHNDVLETLTAVVMVAQQCSFDPEAMFEVAKNRVRALEEQAARAALGRDAKGLSVVRTEPE